MFSQSSNISLLYLIAIRLTVITEPGLYPISSTVHPYYVPVLVGSLNRDRELMYGDFFSQYLNDPSNLFVVSSDFCHWGKRFSYSFYEESNGTISQHIEKLDRMGMDLIEKLDSEAFHNYLKQYKNAICGHHPISVLLCAIESMQRKFSNGHKLEMKFLHYAQSNKASSRNDSSVSYASGVLALQ